MKEKDLRRYIRKEIRLNEDAGDFSAQDVKDVWKSFTDVFKVFGTALKSLLSVLVLNVELVFRSDPEEIRRAFASYDSRSGEFSREYNEVLGPIKQQFEDVEPLLFVANPGAYVAYQFAKDGSQSFLGARGFLRDVGVDIEDSKFLNIAKSALGLDPDDPMERATYDQMRATLGISSTAGTAGSVESIEAAQRKIQQTLDRVFGLATRTTESVLLEQKGPDIFGALEKFYSVGLKEIPPEDFGISSDARSKIADLKRKQADSFAKSLEAPVTFLELLAKAKSIEEVKAAIETLKGTPYVIDGVKQLTPEFLESAAKKALDAARKKNKIDDLFKQIGVPVPEDEKSMLSAVKAYQLKQLLGKTVVDVKTAILKQTEDLREQYTEKYLEDTPLDVMSKVIPGSDIEKTVKAGLEKIRNAGKR